MAFHGHSSPEDYEYRQVLRGSTAMEAASLATQIPARRVPASRTKAITILQRVASKHDVSVEEIATGKRRRDMQWARQEAAFLLAHEANWSQRSIGEMLLCSQRAARVLIGTHENSRVKAKRLLSVDDLKRYDDIHSDDILHRNLILEQERAIVSGQHLADTLAQSLDLLMRCAIVLAITVEHYPRAVRTSTIITLYGDACQALNYGYRQGATESLMAKNFSDLNKTFRSRGWPLATTPGQIPGSRILTPECSDWLDSRLAQPIRSAA